MSCYHPLKAFKYDSTNKLFFVKSDDFKAHEHWESLYKLCKVLDQPIKGVKPIAVPCGQCIGCRLDYSHQWAVRCLLEAKESIPESCYFLTLTYDDCNISENMLRYSCDLSSGEVLFPTLSLCKKDLQDFMKRLRINAYRRYGLENIRFYACGEYGTKSMRPHFHLILFNFDVPRSDLSELKTKAKSGVPLFESSVVMDSWKKGFAPIGFLTYNSACYTAGYMLKKKKGPSAAEYYSQLHIDPEFSVMSRRPGLGSVFYQKNKDYIYANDRLNITVGGRDVNPRPPDYYDILYKAEHGDDSLDEIKEKRFKDFLTAETVLEKRLNMPLEQFFANKESCILENVNRGLSLTL